MRIILVVLFGGLLIASASHVAAAPEHTTKLVYTVKSLNQDGTVKEQAKVTEYHAGPHFRREQELQSGAITNVADKSSYLIDDVTRTVTIMKGQTYADNVARKVLMLSSAKLGKDEEPLSREMVSKTDETTYSVDLPTPNAKLEFQIDPELDLTFQDFADQLLRRSGYDPEGRQTFAKWAEVIEGFPRRYDVSVKAKTNIGIEIFEHFRMEVDSVEQVPFEASLFEIPDGFTTVEMPTGKRK